MYERRKPEKTMVATYLWLTIVVDITLYKLRQQLGFGECSGRGIGMGGFGFWMMRHLGWRYEPADMSEA